MVVVLISLSERLNVDAARQRKRRRRRRKERRENDEKNRER